MVVYHFLPLRRSGPIPRPAFHFSPEIANESLPRTHPLAFRRICP